MKYAGISGVHLPALRISEFGIEPQPSRQTRTIDRNRTSESERDVREIHREGKAHPLPRPVRGEPAGQQGHRYGAPAARTPEGRRGDNAGALLPVEHLDRSPPG